MISSKIKAFSTDYVQLPTSVGIVTAQIIKQPKGEDIILPVEVRTTDGTGAFDMLDGRPKISFAMKNGMLIMREKGFYFGDPSGLLLPYDKNNVKKISNAIINDVKLRNSFLKLHRGIKEGIPEYIGKTNYNVPAVLRKSFQKSASAWQKKWSEKKSVDDCVPTEMVTEMVDLGTQLEDVILSAEQQMLDCLKTCDKKYKDNRELWEVDYFNLGLCELNCIGKTFTDMVVGTIEVALGMTEVVVRYATVCSPLFLVGEIPTPWGSLATAITPEQQALKLLKTISPVIKCLADGKWAIDKLGDLPWPDGGTWPLKINEIPIAIRVCVDQKCAITLRDQLGTLGLTNLPAAISILTATSVVAAITDIVGATTLSTIAATLGLTVPQVAALIAAFILYIVINSLIIAGQILLLDDGKGVCLHKEPIPIVIPTIPTPVIIDIPVIVTPQ